MPVRRRKHAPGAKETDRDETVRRVFAIAVLLALGCTEDFDLAEYQVQAAAPSKESRALCADREPLRKAL